MAEQLRVASALVWNSSFALEPPERRKLRVGGRKSPLVSDLPLENVPASNDNLRQALIRHTRFYVELIQPCTKANKPVLRMKGILRFIVRQNEWCIKSKYCTQQVR
jgi:hypothetical protein